MTAGARPKSHGEKRRGPSMAPVSSKGPSTLVVLRKSHRFLLAKLRELAAEVQVLHRLWYKGAAQFRHMVWWRPVRRVKVLASRITTGSLAQSVPRVRGDAPPTPRRTDAPDEVVGVRVLRSVADAYVSHWDDAHASWSSLPKYEAPPRAALPATQRDAVQAVARDLASALMDVEEQCTLCYAHLQGHLQTPPAPMHAPVSLAVMAVCARMARLAREMRLGEDGATGSLAELARVGR
ncbi:Uncharacterized protein MSYG_2783 [Malassezia sympodialis ATCC 42132]|uniref:Uncharacterized protein n=1 Tax=Malassezia sympodialis (strain ATCC 42132) TaxID=1230383 RepID=A0A1M8A7T7_MALS4|nr:Uncharacterized protein MSYG_2783 [Malassezia sympodialis ATCC 42132]